MVEDSNNNTEFDTKIESELFALVKSVTNLNNKYQKGKINENFFRKALKNAMENIFKIILMLKEKNLAIREILEKMNISQEYKNSIDIINQVSSMNFSTDSPTKLDQNFLELPGITSEITSCFITLMDALTLNDLKKQDLILSLFDDLNNSLSKFPGLDAILSKVEAVQRNVSNNIDRVMYDTKLREKLINDIYSIFNEFQAKLNLNP